MALGNEEENQHEMNLLANDVDSVDIRSHICRYKSYHKSHSDLGGCFFQRIQYHSVVKPILVNTYVVYLCIPRSILMNMIYYED